MSGKVSVRYRASRAVARGAGTLVVAVRPQRPGLAMFDEHTQQALQSLLARGDLEPKAGKTLLVPHVPDSRCERVLLVAQPGDEVSAADYRTMINAAAAALGAIGQTRVTWLLEQVAVREQTAYWKVRVAIAALANRYYRFDQLKSKPGDAPAAPDEVLFVTDGAMRREVDLAIVHATALAEGMATARDLGNLPANMMTPTDLVAAARRIARGAGPRMTAKVLGEKEMSALGMGAFLAVAKASDEEGKLILLHYKGGPKDLAPVVLVGKGITFDTGGVSIKGAAAMDEMKFDMCGAAAVLGTMQVVARLQLPINVVGAVAAAENMVSGRATRPGDIVTTLSGQTVEILNTDAEGRLVLCDALTYIDRYQPGVVIDVATLTGAVVAALGSAASGLWSNDEPLTEQLRRAGETSGDRVWQLPLWDDYQLSLKSNFADMANIGGTEARASVAACFLARFTRTYTWAHLDVAGTAYQGGAAKGSTGRPIPLLTQFLLERAGALP